MGASDQYVTTVAQLGMPVYCVKAVGNRHFMVGGGGGGARTGVKNQLQLFLLNYNQCSTLAVNQKSAELPPLRATLTNTVDTELHSNMNLDLINRDGGSGRETGRFLAAAGQDQYCTIYQTERYGLRDSEEDELDSPSRLSLEFRPLFRLRTDDATRDPYQKCCRFNRCGAEPLQLATGGTDGHVRVWDISEILDNPDPTVNRVPMAEFQVDSNAEIDDLDFSACGSLLAAVSNKNASFWDPRSGRRIADLPPIEKLADKFRVRSIRFTKLGRVSIVFVVAYVQRQRTSKQVSYLALWSYNRETKRFAQLEFKEACKETISSLALNYDDRSGSTCYIAIGTMEGAVYCLDASNLERIYSAPKAHSSFVTGVEFLPSIQEQASEDPRILPKRLPGPGGEAMAALLSLSVDQIVNCHQIPFPKSKPLSSRLLRLAFSSLIVYLLAYLLLVY